MTLQRCHLGVLLLMALAVLIFVSCSANDHSIGASSREADNPAKRHEDTRAFARNDDETRNPTASSLSQHTSSSEPEYANESGLRLLTLALNDLPSKAPASQERLEAGRYFAEADSSMVKLDAAVRKGFSMAEFESPDEIHRFRPLFRYLRDVARLSRSSNKSTLSTQATSRLLRVATAFVSDCDISQRDLSMVADVYAVGAIDDTLSIATAEECDQIKSDISTYLAAWDDPGRMRERSVRRRDARGAPSNVVSSGELDRLAEVLERKLNLQRATYLLLTVRADLRRHWLVHGELPASLTQLSVTAKDPYSPMGDTFKLRRDTPAVVRLYSVGPDQIDDGGLARPFTELLTGAKGDLVSAFELQ